MNAVAVQLPHLTHGQPIVLLRDLDDLAIPLIHIPCATKPAGTRHIDLWLRLNEAPVNWPTLCGHTGVLYLYCNLFRTCDLCPDCTL